MKKFLFAIACVLGMTSCDSSVNSNVNTEVIDSTEVVTDSVTSIDSVVVETVDSVM